MTSFLTGNKDIDTKILLDLNEFDLSNLALIDNFTNKIIKNDSFWKMKFSQRYENIEFKDELYLFEKESWKSLWEKINFDLYDVFKNSIKFNKINLTKLLLKDIDSFEKICENVEMACIENNLEYIELILKNYDKKSQYYFDEFFFNIRIQRIQDKTLIKLIDLFVKFNINISGADLSQIIKNGRRKIVKHILQIENLKNEMNSYSREIFQDAAYYFEKTDDYEMIQILVSSYLNNSWGFK